jgi:aminopeptidase N
MNKLLPIIVKNKITSQMPNIAQTVAFYPFIGFQNPALATCRRRF